MANRWHQPRGKWYLEVGNGMGETLMMASEKKSYRRADRSTFLAFREKVSLEALVEGDLALRNTYWAIAVSPKLHRRVYHAEARRFIEWIVSADAQKMIEDVGREKFGVSLFRGTATPAKAP